MRTPEDLWWKDIAGAAAYIEDLTDTLNGNRIPVLCSADGLPWPETMQAQVQEALRSGSGNSDLMVLPIDRHEDPAPVEACLAGYIPRRLRDCYRGSSAQGLAVFFRREGCLRNKILWVRCPDEKDLQEWLTFFELYGPSSPETGGCVLEFTGSPRPDVRKKLARALPYADYVSRHDVQLFASLLSRQSDAGRKMPGVWKEYAAAVAARLCETDAEFAAALLEDVDFRHVQPDLEKLEALAEAHGFRREAASAGHITYHILNGDREEITRRIWAAQVQVLFPLIELETSDIVHRFEKEIAEALQAEKVEQYGNRITDIGDVEIGTLYYMMTTRRKSDKESYLFYVREESLREKITDLHEFRNRLAHGKLCSPEEADRLMGMDNS